MMLGFLKIERNIYFMSFNYQIRLDVAKESEGGLRRTCPIVNDVSSVDSVYVRVNVSSPDGLQPTQRPDVALGYEQDYGVASPGSRLGNLHAPLTIEKPGSVGFFLLGCHVQTLAGITLQVNDYKEDSSISGY